MSEHRDHGHLGTERLSRMYRHRWIVIGVNVFAIVMALVAPPVAVGLYLITTGMVLALPFLSLGRRR